MDEIKNFSGQLILSQILAVIPSSIINGAVDTGSWYHPYFVLWSQNAEMEPIKNMIQTGTISGYPCGFI